MLKFERTDEMKRVINREDRRGSRYQFVASFRVTGLRRSPAQKITRTPSWIGQKFLDLYEYVALLVLAIRCFFSLEDFGEAVVKRVGSEADTEGSDEGGEIGAMHLLFVRAKDAEVTRVSLNRLTSDGAFCDGPKRDLGEIMTQVSNHPDQYREVFDSVLTNDLKRHGLTPRAFRELVWQCAIDCAVT